MSTERRFGKAAELWHRPRVSTRGTAEPRPDTLTRHVSCYVYLTTL